MSNSSTCVDDWTIDEIKFMLDSVKFTSINEIFLILLYCAFSRNLFRPSLILQETSEILLRLYGSLSIIFSESNSIDLAPIRFLVTDKVDRFLCVFMASKSVSDASKLRPLLHKVIEVSIRLSLAKASFRAMHYPILSLWSI